MKSEIGKVPATVSSAGVSIAPTRTRYWVIVFAVTLAIITYVDRVCISKAAPLIQQDLGLTKQAVFQILQRRSPSGCRARNEAKSLVKVPMGKQTYLSFSQSTLSMWSDAIRQFCGRFYVRISRSAHLHAILLVGDDK